MNWDQRYREASLKDWADKQRTRNITREFQNVSKEDAHKHSKKMVDYHDEMADHHDEMARFITQSDDQPNIHYFISDMHANAADAHKIAISLLENPLVDDATRWKAIEHANETTRHADVMTNVERSYLDPQDDEEE